MACSSCWLGWSLWTSTTVPLRSPLLSRSPIAGLIHSSPLRTSVPSYARVCSLNEGDVVFSRQLADRDRRTRIQSNPNESVRIANRSQRLLCSRRRLLADRMRADDSCRSHDAPVLLQLHSTHFLHRNHIENTALSQILSTALSHSRPSDPHPCRPARPARCRHSSMQQNDGTSLRQVSEEGTASEMGNGRRPRSTLTGHRCLCLRDCSAAFQM